LVVRLKSTSSLEQATRRRGVLFGVLLGLRMPPLLGASIVFLSVVGCQLPTDLPLATGGVGTLRLPNGELSLEIRLDRSLLEAEWDMRSAVVEATFTNRTSELVRLQRVRVVELGLLEVREDSEGEDTCICSSPSIENPSRLSATLDLADTSARAIDVVELGGRRSFRATLALERSGPETICRDTVLRPSDALHHRDLDELEPKVVRSDHWAVFVVETRMGSVYSDCVLVLGEKLERELIRFRSGWFRARVPVLPPRVVTPEAATRLLVEEGIRTHRETTVHRLASEWIGSEALEPVVDPDAVSPYCFWHDSNSPYRELLDPIDRGEHVERTEIGWREFEGSIERTNAPDLLARIRDEHPALWPPMNTALRDRERDPDLAVRRKAAYLRSRILISIEPHSPDASWR